jgi:hypothetical protein
MQTIRLHVLCSTLLGGNLEMDAQQKADLLSFVHDDGKGFVGVHTDRQRPKVG